MALQTSSPNLLDFEQNPPYISTPSRVTGKPITHLHPSLTQPFLNVQNVSRFPVSPPPFPMVPDAISRLAQKIHQKSQSLSHTQSGDSTNPKHVPPILTLT